jgi:Ca2+-binding RTX toxin-like protein
VRTTTLTAAALLGLTLLTPAQAATTTAETCLSRPATVVGTGPTVTGTEGRDVIVSGTATTIEALGGDDLVCVSQPGQTPVVLAVDAGSGSDMVVVETADVVATGSRVGGGRGRDQLIAAQPGGRLAVNLRRDRWLLDSRSATVTGLEDVTLVAPSVRILGDDEDNTLGSSACFAKLDGNGGDDYLGNRPRRYFEDYTFDCDGSSRMHGGQGADRIQDADGDGTLHGGPGHDTIEGRDGDDQLDGGTGRDVLIGGTGRDRADGGSGRDRCRTEREMHCER